MENKVLNTLFIVSLILLIPCAIFGFIYDVFIWDKSLIPNGIYNLFWVVGYIALFGMLISIVFDKIIKRNKEKKLAKRLKEKEISNEHKVTKKK